MNREVRGLREIVVQFTSCELRQRVRHNVGMGLLTPVRSRLWRMMAYGVLANRKRIGHDGRKAKTRAEIAAQCKAIAFKPRGGDVDAL